MSVPYPEHAAGRDAWILSRRPERTIVDPAEPYAFLVEDECSAAGVPEPVATVFLTNRECPWRCLMCDLWRNTTPATVPRGTIAEQVRYALDRLASARQIKLYNSGSFFDAGAIPVTEYAAVARLLQPFKRVIVESHPALVGERCLRFRDLIGGRLEVAMGLETVDPDVLPRLNKRMTLPQFEAAAQLLRTHDIDLRVFVLVRPPFQDEAGALDWAKRSLDMAFACGATAVSLIPVRGGNGALDELQHQGHFAPPKLDTLEHAVRYGLGLRRGRVFADLWEIHRIATCPSCSATRIAALKTSNLTQHYPATPRCPECVS